MRVLNPDAEDGVYLINANRNGSVNFYIVIRGTTPTFTSTASGTVKGPATLGGLVGRADGIGILR